MIQHEVSMLGIERFEQAKSICCEYWNVDKSVVFSKTRLRNVINARHSIRYMLYTQKKFSLAEIGGLTNGDHTTVMHSRKTFLNLSDSDEDFRVLFNRITKGNKLRSKVLLHKKIELIMNGDDLDDTKVSSLYNLIRKSSVSK